MKCVPLCTCICLCFKGVQYNCILKPSTALEGSFCNQLCGFLMSLRLEKMCECRICAMLWSRDLYQPISLSNSVSRFDHLISVSQSVQTIPCQLHPVISENFSRSCFCINHKETYTPLSKTFNYITLYINSTSWNQ